MRPSNLLATGKESCVDPRGTSLITHEYSQDDNGWTDDDPKSGKDDDFDQCYGERKNDNQCPMISRIAKIE